MTYGQTTCANIVIRDCGSASWINITRAPKPFYVKYTFFRTCGMIKYFSYHYIFWFQNKSELTQNCGIYPSYASACDISKAVAAKVAERQEEEAVGGWL